MTTATMMTTILAFLATYLVHSTILMGAAWALGRFVLRAEAWRETLWKAALVGGVATTLVAQALPLAPVRISWSTAVGAPWSAAGSDAVTGTRTTPEARVVRAGEAPRRELDDGAASTAAGASLRVTRDGATQPAAPVLEPEVVAPWSLARWLVSAWVVIAIALAVRLAIRRLRLAGILRDRRPVTDPALTGALAELRRSAGHWAPVRLSASSSVASPLLVGRREICVPERFLAELGRDEQRAALAHELGHLVRRDPAWQSAALLLECIFFFQPLQRVARRRLRESAEFLADAWAVRLSGERLGLARCLSEVAAWVAPHGEPSLAHTVAMAEGGSPLLERVSRLLEREPEREPRSAARVAVGLALIVLTTLAAPGVGAVPGRVSDGTPALEGTAGAEGMPPAQVQTAPSIVRVPPEGGLEARMAVAEAGAAERATSRYWLAWAVPTVLPATTHVSMDSEEGINIHVTDERYPVLASMGRGGAPAAVALGVEGELAGGGDGYDVLVLARVDSGSDGARPTRLAVRSPAMPLRVSGEVYWLGRAEVEDGFEWQVRQHRQSTHRRVGELAVKAAALHDAVGVEDFLRATAGDAASGRDVRESAIEGLAYHPSDETLDFLARIARTDPDLTMRTEAVETLGELEHPGAMGEVRDLARSGDPRVREEAVESLGEGQDPGVMATLIQVARSDPDPDIRVDAVEAIGEQPPNRALPALRALIDGEADREVRVEVAEQLGELGTPEALAVLDDLVAADPDDDVVEKAVEAIAEGFASEVAAPRLEAVSRDHPSEEVRREALDQLLDLRLGGPGGGEILLDIALNHAAEEWRVDAVERMTDLPADDAVPLLSRVFSESGDVEVRTEVAEALGEVGTPAALAALEDIVNSGSVEEVMIEAVESIGEEFTREQAIPVLQQIVTGHASARVRREALGQLADLGTVR